MIISSLGTYNELTLRFIHTLRATGYLDKITLIMDKLPKELKNKLKLCYGADVMDVDISPDKWNLPMDKLSWRWALYANLVKQNPNEDYIILDQHDIVFQNNNFNIIPGKVNVCGEGITFKQDATGINVGWMNANPQLVANLPKDWMDKEIINGGMIAGKGSDILPLCQAVLNTHSGSDQSTLNAIVIQNPDKFIINKDLWTCLNSIPLNKNAIIHANGSNVKPIIDNIYPPSNYGLLHDRMMKVNNQKEQMHPTLTLYTPTKGRTDTTLPQMLQSILDSTIKPDLVVIYDDNKEKGKITEVIKYQLNQFKLNGIKIHFLNGFDKGQVTIHEHARQNCFTDYNFRLDDDCILEPKTIEILMETIIPRQDVAAVSCSIIDPCNVQPTVDIASAKISDVIWSPNVQWTRRAPGLIEAEHLYSGFIYRRSASKHPYNSSLSPVGHREETIFSHGFVLNGYKLLINTGTTIWHYRFPIGGIRQETKGEMWENDEGVFQKWIHDNKIQLNQPLFCFVSHGLGDNYAFLSILPELKEKWKDRKIIIGASYPDVFKGELGITLTNAATMEALVGRQFCENASIYRWMGFMDQFGFKPNLQDSYRYMYGIKEIPSEILEKVNDNGKKRN